MKYLILVIFLSIVGCSATKYFTSKGEELYYEKCAGCHRLYQKSELSVDEWKVKLDEMAKRAKLDDEEKRLVLTYLTK